MHVLAIDVGSYSVKYLSSSVDRRRISHGEMSEIIIHDYQVDHPDLSLLECQVNIIQEIIDNTARPDTRVIYQADNEMLTTRFLTLPVKSKKKAELMLPFQLEEDIPYALSEIHYSYRMEGQKTQHVALVELVRVAAFDPYYNLLKEKDILPNILTTEASAQENYFNQNTIAGPFCILNIGHRTTKAYFFYNSRLLVTHLNYTGGYDVNEMIAQTYKIDAEQAVIYKHQNAFLLTSSQYDEVEDSQKEFALAMDKVFAPLIADFTRWKIGFKVNYGLSLGHVFICGGTANIKNIANYLTEKWDVKVSLLETFDKDDHEKIDVNAKNKSKFALANMMIVGFRRKNRFINFLTGKFAQASTAEIPLHSFAFIGVRVAAICLVFAISLFAERIFTGLDITEVNKKLATLMKDDELAISGRLRRAAATNPKPILDSLVKKQRSVRQEISTLQSAIDIQALTPLVTVSQLASGATTATMTEFKSDDIGNISALFKAENVSDLERLKESFERSQFIDVVVEIDQAKKTLKLTAQGI
jgi:general secretion pathway protein L